MKTFYKIVEYKKEFPYTLFHGVRGSRKLSVGDWIKAENKWVRDGTGKYYSSGFHVFPSMDIAIKYLKRFNAPKDRRIVPCNARNVSVKPTNKEVLLAQWVRILNEENKTNS